MTWGDEGINTPPAWYTDTMAPRSGASGLPKYELNDPSAKLGVMMPESLTEKLLVSILQTRLAFCPDVDSLSVEKPSYAQE